jgi:hypothetical protein
VLKASDPRSLQARSAYEDIGNKANIHIFINQNLYLNQKDLIDRACILPAASQNPQIYRTCKLNS